MLSATSYLFGQTGCTPLPEVCESDEEMEKRSRRRIRDLEKLFGLFENESGCARISIMAKSTKSSAEYGSARPIPPSLTSGLRHTAGPYRPVHTDRF